jgi:Carbon storage regulator (could also regulate swarming and quorum sensing)
MLVISRKTGEALVVSDNIKITIVSIGNDKVSIGIEAPKEIKIVRQELLETIEANMASAEEAELKDYKNIATLMKLKNNIK